MREHLPVEAIQQEFSWSCVAACARMALLYIDIDVAELQLCRLLETLPLGGTQPESIVNLRALGVQVVFGRHGMRWLEHQLELGNPPLVFLRTLPLPYWKVDEPHAVLLIGRSQSSVFVIDPAFSATVHEIRRANFAHARRLGKNRVAVITRPSR